MKYLLTFILSTCLLVQVNAQELTSRLIGTWQIKSYNYNGQEHTNKDAPSTKYKSYTPTNFSGLEIDTASGIILTSIFGTYQLKEGVYTETVLGVNKESAGMMGKTFSFKLAFSGPKTLETIGSFNGINSTEVWERVTDKNTNRILERIPGIDSQPLYVLQNKSERFIIKTSSENEDSPMGLIPQNAIASLEVLKDATATEIYGLAGRKGVIIITIIEAKQANILEKMKSAGLIDTKL
jgi:TonB-dependent SusC/RagA subfamily outer membrane receptor